MTGFKHGMKRRFSRATTSTKTIESHMSTDYTSAKHTLARQKSTLEKSLKLLTSSRAAWLDLSKNHKQLTDLIVADATVDSAFYPHAAEAAAASNSLYEHLANPPAPDAPPQRLEAHVKTYLAEIAALEKKFHDVESTYTEVSRYERKVGKLSDRSAKSDKAGPKADKAKERTRRNLDKLASERAAYQSKLDGIIDMMKRTSAKFDTILACVHGSFWLQNSTALADASTYTLSVRDNALAAQDRLLKLDVSQIGALPEAPAVPAITAPPASTSAADTPDGADEVKPTSPKADTSTPVTAA